MERPSEVDDYIKWTKTANEAKKKVEELKPKIKEILNESDGFKDCYFQKVTKTIWHEDILYDWIQREHPELLDEVSKITVDIDKLGKLLKKGKLKRDTIPYDCVGEEVSYSICTRERKEDDQTYE